MSKWLCGAAPTASHRQLDNEQNLEEGRHMNPRQMRAARHTYRELNCQAWTTHFFLVCMFSRTKIPEKQGAAYGQAPSFAAQQSVYATYTMRHVSFFLPATPLLHMPACTHEGRSFKCTIAHVTRKGCMHAACATAHGRRFPSFLHACSCMRLLLLLRASCLAAWTANTQAGGCCVRPLTWGLPCLLTKSWH